LTFAERVFEKDPKTKLQAPEKHQAPITKAERANAQRELEYSLELGIWCFSGSWSLELRSVRNANRASEPGLGANECVPPGMWRKPTTFRHSYRSHQVKKTSLTDTYLQQSKRIPFFLFAPVRFYARTVRLISGVALDECLALERYQTRAPFSIFVEGVRIDEELARKASVVYPIASANLAPSANSGRSPG